MALREQNPLLPSSAAETSTPAWPENKYALSVGPVIHQLLEYVEDATEAMLELSRAVLTPGERDTFRILLARSWMKGRDFARMPKLAGAPLEKLTGIEWKNLKPHVVGLRAKELIRETAWPDGDGVDYFPHRPRSWKCDWNWSRDEQLATIIAIEENGKQEWFKLGPMELPPKKKTEAQNKSGEARPSSTEIQAKPAESELPGIPPPAASTENQVLPASDHEPSSSNAPGAAGSTPEIQKFPASLKASAGSELLTAEAVKTLRDGGRPEIQREAARGHIFSLSVEQRRTFCGNIALDAGKELLRLRIRQHIKVNEWENFGGQWTNAIKLDAGAVRRVLDERQAMNKEGRDGRLRTTEGARLFDMLRKFSPLIATWYPKPSQ